MARVRAAPIALLAAALCLGGGWRIAGAGEDAEPRPRPLSVADWSWWWVLNRDAWEIPRWSALGRHGGRPPAREAPGPGDVPVPYEEVRQVVLPVLREVLRAREPEGDLQMCAYLQLAKTTRDPQDIHWLTSRLRVDRWSRPAVRGHDSYIVEESAVLALGLLRRSDPALRFPAASLDGVRELLFQILLDDDRRPRSRASAALALGLLGDQPTGVDGSVDIAKQATTARLFDLLARFLTDEELAVGILAAIALQPPASVATAHRRLLRDLAVQGRRGEKPVADVVAAWALWALARLDLGDELAPLERILRAKSTVSVARRRAAALALGVEGRDRPAGARILHARALLGGLVGEEDATARHLARMSLAHLLRADAAEGTSGVLEDGGARAALLAALASGDAAERSSAAVALGFVLRALPAPVPEGPWRDLQLEARTALLAGLRRTNLDRSTRAAFHLAAGLARDRACRPFLFDTLGDENADSEVRVQAARAVGLLRSVDAEEAQVLARVLRSAPPFDLLGETSRAVAALGQPILAADGEMAIDVLRRRLSAGPTANARQEAVLGMAFAADPRALPDLAAVVRDGDASTLTRALACLALGVLADPEWSPSLQVFQTDVDFWTHTDAMNEVWSIY